MDIQGLRDKALKEMEVVDDTKELELWRIKYIGRKSELSALLGSLKNMAVEEKRVIGPAANKLKKEFEEAYKKRDSGYASSDSESDMTVPGKLPQYGHCHPLTIVKEDIERIFSNMNFSIVEGPEAETEHYNFDALNFPKHHPARDMQDTLWINREKGWLMRTQTSAMQIRYMQKHTPPVRIIVPGRVFRHEATDASHEMNFYQFEGLMVENGGAVSLAHFKWIIAEFCKQFFETSMDMRFRPSYFPFVEPGVEVDIRMPRGQWLEVMGAGMVHPKVFSAVGYDPKRVQGFAFGGGMDRFAMIKYGIPDIRLFYGGDLRFIRQFS